MQEFSAYMERITGLQARDMSACLQLIKDITEDKREGLTPLMRYNLRRQAMQRMAQCLWLERKLARGGVEEKQQGRVA